MRPDRYLIPAGKCPAELKGTARADVEAWMDAVQAAYGDPGANPERLCGSSTFMYYAQQFFPRFGKDWTGTSAEYLEVCAHIRASFGLPPGVEHGPRLAAPGALRPKPSRPKAPPPPPKPKTAADLAAAATRGGWAAVRTDAEVLEAERAAVGPPPPPRRKAPPPPGKK